MTDLLDESLESIRLTNNLTERGLRDIREMSQEIERCHDLEAYGDALKFIKPFHSGKGERIKFRLGRMPRYPNGWRWCGQCGEAGPRYAKACPTCGKLLRVHPSDKSKMELKRIG